MLGCKTRKVNSNLRLAYVQKLRQNQCVRLKKMIFLFYNSFFSNVGKKHESSIVGKGFNALPDDKF